jgi:hypothetical protein
MWSHAGRWFVRELRSSDTPDELLSRTCARLTPELARAQYQLVADTDHTLRYQRRYLPTAVMLLGLLLTAASAYVIAGGLPRSYGVPWPAAAVGAAGIALLVLVRRAEVLIVTVSPRPGGSGALVAGYVNDRARIALRTWSPPIRPNLRCVTHPGHQPLPATRSGAPRDRAQP